MTPKTGVRVQPFCGLFIPLIALLLSACGGGGGGASSAAGSSVPPTATQSPPSIMAQPASVAVSAGEPATFSVTVSSAVPVTYQWQQGGSDIAGATSATYVLATTTLSESGAQFSVTVSNTGGNVTSSIATLTVSAIAPVITAQPASVAVSAGQPAIFSVSASGTQPLSYQWQRGGANIAGATSASYSLSATALSDSGAQFGVTVSNSAGDVSSSIATLTVNVIAPLITAQPASVAVSAGQPATFSVAAGGTLPLSYQWQRGGTNIAGATAASYTLPSTALTDNAAQFDVVVTNAGGVATSSLATLTVNAVAPAIVSQPQAQSVPAGSTATFSVGATGTTPLSYQWKKNGAPLTGAMSSSYTTPVLGIADSGSTFSVVVSNPASTVATSNAATLTVTPVAASIVTQPLSQTVVSGNTATFSVVANGTAPLSYQWNKNGAPITGATSPSYTTPPVGAADSGSTFTVVVSNAASSAATSNPATLTVTSIAPSIITQPQSQTVAVGATATFSVTAAGSAPLSYQWQKNSVNIPGATGASYTTPAVTSADSGSAFVVVVSNAATPAATSNPATLTVASTPPSITTQPQSQTVAFGATVTFSVVATGSAPLSYQWQKNGVNIAGATASSYTTPAVGATDSGSSFLVVVSNAATPAATSNAATLTVTHTLSLIAGELGGAGHADGTGTSATFYTPTNVTSDSAGNIYVADQTNQTIRVITPAGVVSTLAGTPGVVGSTNGTGAAALFNGPNELAVDASGNVYVADTGNDTIREITPGGVVTTYAGTAGVSGSRNSPGALFNAPRGVAVYQPSIPGPVTLFVADTGNNTIRMIDSSGNVTTFAGTAGVQGPPTLPARPPDSPSPKGSPLIRRLEISTWPIPSTSPSDASRSAASSAPWRGRRERMVRVMAPAALRASTSLPPSRSTARRRISL